MDGDRDVVHGRHTFMCNYDSLGPGYEICGQKATYISWARGNRYDYADKPEARCDAHMRQDCLVDHPPRYCAFCCWENGSMIETDDVNAIAHSGSVQNFGICTQHNKCSKNGCDDEASVMGLISRDPKVNPPALLCFLHDTEIRAWMMIYYKII